VRMSSDERLWDSITPRLATYAVATFGGQINYVDPANIYNVFSGTYQESFTSIPETAFQQGTSIYRASVFPYEGIFGEREQDRKDDFVAFMSTGNFQEVFLISIIPAHLEIIRRMTFLRGSGFYWDGAGGINKFSGFTGGISLRYGLANYNAQFSSAIFRRDRYGQFRDMLEQRQYTTFKSERGSTDPVVTNIFVSASSETRVDSLLTNCSNVSQYATSSVPYFDGDFRNRTTYPSASLNQTFKPSLILS